MNVDFWTKWVTLIGATIAAGSGVWSLKLQIQGKRDSYRIDLGTVVPEANEEQFLNVVSRCDHPIVLADYGFIDKSGRLRSIVMDAELDAAFRHFLIQRGSVKLEKRGAQFEAGYVNRQLFIGCFARTNLETRPTITFAPRAPMLIRMRIRLRVIMKGSWYLA